MSAHRENLIWLGLSALGLGILIVGLLAVIAPDGRLSEVNLSLQLPDINPGSMFNTCSSGGDWEMTVALMVGDYPTPCSDFFHLYRPVDEFYHRVQLNSFGLHDAPVTIEKPADTFRVLLVGDDMTQAWEVPREQGFHHLTEDRLNALADGRVEVINSGIGGYGTDRQLLHYATLGARFQPDVVLLVVNLTDDLVNNQVALEALRSGSMPGRPFFTLEDERLTLHNSSQFNPLDGDTLAYNWLVELQTQQTPPPDITLPEQPTVTERGDDSRELSYPVELGIYLPEDAYWSQAWALTEELIVTFRDVVEQEGAQFGVVIIPEKRSVDYYRDRTTRWDFTVSEYPDLPLTDVDPTAPAARLEDVLTAHDITVLNAQWSLSNTANNNPVDWLYYFHQPQLNARGHDVIADRLVPWLVAEGMTP